MDATDVRPVGLGSIIITSPQGSGSDLHKAKPKDRARTLHLQALPKFQQDQSNRDLLHHHHRDKGNHSSIHHRNRNPSSLLVSAAAAARSILTTTTSVLEVLVT